jgi:hypothetical protein
MVMKSPHSYRAGAAGMLLLACLATTAALPGWGSPMVGAEATGQSAAHAQRTLAMQAIADRLQSAPRDGLRVSSLGSHHPVKLSRPLVLTYYEANRMAGWVASLQQSVYQRMGDTIDTLSLVEVTKAEAGWYSLAFAIDERWFAVDHLDLNYFGRVAMSDPGGIRDLLARTACRFMSRVAEASANQGSCADNPDSAVVIAGR